METKAPWWRVAVGAAVYAGLIGSMLAATDFEPLVVLAIVLVVTGSVASPVIGAWVIWKIVRSVNRHDDPRYTRRPHESP